MLYFNGKIPKNKFLYDQPVTIAYILTYNEVAKDGVSF